jgi:hypothetical protein
MENNSKDGTGREAGSDPQANGTGDAAHDPAERAGGLPKRRSPRAHRVGKGNPGGDPADARRDAGTAVDPGPLELAKAIATPDRKEAPDDPEAKERWPNIHFLLGMHKSLANDFCDSAGFSVFCRGGAYVWSLKAPGTNRKLSGRCFSLASLFDDMETAYAQGEADISILKKEREAKFQERINKI